MTEEGCKMFGQHCPHCGEELVLCDWPNCGQWAYYEGWVGPGGGLMQRLKLCPEHVKETYAYKKHGKKALGEAK